ncbi:hypothetical protein EXN66_Car003274 [Channa argus]|uniref:Uncharacterized protein n=2 Tax=Channa argus TaxID=215402 RepID=A0A6G1PBI8_CHAAH|nr:hypothetical protein EXN66_Car003274 [Channa argus]
MYLFILARSMVSFKRSLPCDGSRFASQEGSDLHICKKGLLTSNQSSAVVTFQDDKALQPEPEVAPANVMPAEASHGLKEVQQAVQVASEQVESRGAEEVLKVLMEKVVEAALRQVEGRGEVRRGEAAVQEAVTENVLGAEEEGAYVKTEVKKKEVEGEYMEAKGEDTVVGKQTAEVQRGIFRDVAEEGKGVIKWEGEITAASMEETTTGIENEERQGVLEVSDESLDTDVSHKVVKESIVALEEIVQDLTINETEVGDRNEQVVLSKRKGEYESNLKQAGETPAVVKVAQGGDLAQTENARGKEEETQIDEKEREVMIKPDNYATKHTVVVEEEEVENLVDHAEGAEVDKKQDHTVMEGGVAKEKQAERTDVTETAEEEKDEESEISEILVNEGSDQQAGEEEETQVALETSDGIKTQDQEMLVISAPVPKDSAEASMEQSLENQAPTTGPSLTGVEKGENTLGDVKFNHGNEIITPTNDLLPHSHVVANPTLDDFVRKVLTGHPQAEGHEPGETNELIEEIARTRETSELGLQAWKIGAISAAVFLVLETAVIFYVLKCRKKNSTPALQRECEEGCVEPEEATGGDCSDDTLPADMNMDMDTEQYVYI